MKIFNNKLSIIISITTLFTLTAVGYLYFNRPPLIYWGEKSRQMYRFSSNTFFHMPNQAERLAVHGGIEMKGIVNLRIFTVDSGQIRAGFQISPVYVKYKGKQNKGLEELFSKLFYVSFLPDGSLKSFDFPNDISLEDEEKIKNLIKNIQVIIPSTLFRSWTTEESDIYGLYNAHYNYNKRLTKYKKDYKEIFSFTGFTGNCESVEILESIVNIEYGYPDTWIKNLIGKSLTAFYNANGDMLVKFSSSISLKKIPFNPDKNLALWSNRKPIAEISAWKNNPKETVSIALRNELQRLNYYFGNINFSEFVVKQFAKYIQFSPSCIDEFLFFLKLHPEAVLEIPEYILKNDLNKDQRAMLINILKCEQSTTAQKALVKITQGEKYPPDSRIQSAMALGDIKRPDNSVLSSLWENYRERDIENDINRKVSNTSLLSLGRISRRMSKNETDEDRHKAEEIKTEIQSELSTVNDVSSRCAMIRAAANTGDRNFVIPIIDCFNSYIPAIRSSAAHSLSGYSGDDIDSVLAEELSNEEDPNVRTSLINAMHNRNANYESVEKICHEIQFEENDIVRGEMYRFLLKYRKRPGVKETLLKLQKTEHIMANKRLISRALSTKK